MLSSSPRLYKGAQVPFEGRLDSAQLPLTKYKCHLVTRLEIPNTRLLRDLYIYIYIYIEREREREREYIHHLIIIVNFDFYLLLGIVLVFKENN